MLKSKIIYGLLFLVLFWSAPSSAQEKIYIDVGQAAIKKSLLALPAFQHYGSASDRRSISLGHELFEIISNDLTVSGLFTFIKPDAFLEDPAKVGLRPAPGDPNGFDFKNWKTIGTEFLVRGGYRTSGDRISLEVYVYYVPQARLVMGKTYEGKSKDVRLIAHTFADDLMEKLTGKKSIFKTKIAVSSTYDSGKFKEILIMDWDGANKKKITNYKSIAISPAWSFDGKKVAYTAFAYHPSVKSRNADLFVYEIDAGKHWLVSFRKGINSGAAFFPDGRNLLITISQKNPDIFKMTADGKSLIRLTDGPNGAMNVEPAVSHDGRRIAFSSDRSGRPMIYTMNADGSNVKRITIAGKYNATPSWSPDGKKIAFAGYDKDHFDIFVMNADGTGMKRLTGAKKANGKWADNEDPTFSPDGRFIMFISDRTGNKQLYLIDVEGNNERRITTDRYDYFKPKWSPFMD